MCLILIDPYFRVRIIILEWYMLRPKSENRTPNTGNFPRNHTYDKLRNAVTGIFRRWDQNVVPLAEI